MLTLIHGEDTTASRQELTRLREDFTGEVLAFPLEEATPENLAQVLTSNSLFSVKKLIILENFFTSRKKPPKDFPKVEDNIDVIAWEGKKLTATQVKVIEQLLPTIKVQEFKQNQVVFQFVESLRPKNQKQMLTLFREYLTVESPEIIFAMITRQFRLLLLAQTNSADGPDDYLRLSPWQRAKLAGQAKAFGSKHIQGYLAKLLDIDFKIKTGQSPVDLRTALELLLLQL